VHHYISRDNDKLITKAVNSGLRRMRAGAGPSGKETAP